MGFLFFKDPVRCTHFCSLNFFAILILKKTISLPTEVYKHKKIELKKKAKICDAFGRQCAPDSLIEQILLIPCQ